MAMIDGKKISAETREQIALDAQKLMAETGIRPGLAVVIVGDDPASHVYVKNKKKGCEQVGFYSEEYALPEQTSQEELMQLLDRLNADPKIHGILVQLPLPRHLDEKAVIERDFAIKRCRRVPCGKCGKNYDWQLRFSALHACRCNGVDPFYWYFGQRERMCGYRPQQYCW